SSKSRRMWQPLLVGDEPAIMLELVFGTRLIGVLTFSPSLTWLEAAAQEAGWIERRLEPWLPALRNRVRIWLLEHELGRLREQVDQGQRLRLDGLIFDAERQEIVGASGGLRPVMERIELIARSDV